MTRYTFTVHYDGIADDISDTEYERASARYYDALNGADIIDVTASDIHGAYDNALDASDHGLSISHIDVLIDGTWQNIHAILDGGQ